MMRVATCRFGAVSHRASTPVKMSAQLPRAMESVAEDNASMKLTSPSAERNKQYILEELVKVLGKSGRDSTERDAFVLEVASGTGQHVAHYAAALPAVTFQPSEVTRETFDSIQSWTKAMSNVSTPILLDASLEWQVPHAGDYSVVVVANMCHISPWSCTLGLFAGSAKALHAGGHLLVYGPFKRDGKCTTESNAAFDASLQQRNPAWGYRDVQDMQTAAEGHGLRLIEVIDMPANNFSLVFEKSALS